MQIGEVRQRTGEDWSNVRLTLSTARPSVSARLPELDPWFIEFVSVGHRPVRKGNQESLGSELTEPRDNFALKMPASPAN